jgi:hypothetical protein
MKIAVTVAASVLFSSAESALVLRRQAPAISSIANASFNQVIEAACQDKSVGEVTCNLLRSFRVCGACKGSLQRIGEQKDGGYLTCETTGTAGPVAGLSFGINGFDGWGDQYAAKHQIPMYQYDCFNHNVPNCPSGRCHFSPTCVQDGGHYDNSSFQTLAALMDQTSPSQEVIVKMDVESAEWGSISLTDDAHLGRIQQLILEFHGLGDSGRHGEFLGVMQKLLRHFQVVHNHGNNCCKPATFGAYIIPSVFEVTFVRKDLADIMPCASTHPHAQDAPNVRGGHHHPPPVKLEPFL